MGVVSFDVKRIIGELLLLGGTGAVLKRVEELQETSSGRLHLEFEFFSVSENTEKVESVVKNIAAAEVEEKIQAQKEAPHAQKSKTGLQLASTTKEEVEDRTKKLVAGLTTKGRESLIAATASLGPGQGLADMVRVRAFIASHPRAHPCMYATRVRQTGETSRASKIETNECTCGVSCVLRPPPTMRRRRIRKRILTLSRILPRAEAAVASGGASARAAAAREVRVGK